ncbi:MAG: tRNA uracil 4-sulfurtransferase ThiI [Patescibacteria group bacterium]
MNNIIIHYNEIALKGKNRIFFEKKLRENIKNAFRGLSVTSVSRLPGRILVEISEKNIGEALEKAAKIPGISSYSPAMQVETALDKMKEGALKIAKEAKGKTFKVETKRGYKEFPLDSIAISREVGAYVVKKSKLAVDVKNPDITINLEVLKNKTFIYSEKIKGSGGLPFGGSGKMLSLISGGIDSPVASYLMMRRGADLEFVHFHSYPYTDKASIEKAEELVKILNQRRRGSVLYLVPIIDFQKEVVKKANPKYRIILYRRLMYKIGLEIAKNTGAKALVSGDNLGQVASQTIENLASVGAGIDVPILRPLIGFDKEEIISLAKKIGTYGVSVEHHDDCCSIFTPKNPATKSRIDDIIKEEKILETKKWVKKIIKNIEVKNIG